MATRTKTTSPLLQLKIELAGIKPLIWRRVVVPETITLAKLHQVIQAAMGWTDSHLHEFEIAGELYGMPDRDDSFGPAVLSEARATLGKSLGNMASFRYVYDFGDDWGHKVKVEKVGAPDTCPTPIYLGGANACPPEDIGGPYGYADFLEAISDPAHPEHQQMRDWIGQEFDPKAIDHNMIEFRLRDIKL